MGKFVIRRYVMDYHRQMDECRGKGVGGYVPVGAGVLGLECWGVGCWGVGCMALVVCRSGMQELKIPEVTHPMIPGVTHLKIPEVTHPMIPGVTHLKIPEVTHPMIPGVTHLKIP